MQTYEQIAIDIAKQAGDIMRTNFRSGMKKDWKEDNTPLTVSDTIINDLVLKTIGEAFPDHGVLGEERNSDRMSSDYLWVLDPIDGTIPFSHGMPLFVFSLALTHKGESILGVIYDPILDRMLYAEKGKGAFLNNQPVHVSNKNTVNQTLIEVQSWKGYEHNLNPLKDQLIQQGAQVTTICTVIYAALLVAIGEYGGILFSGTKPWDAAAVKIIVEEAGGKVTDLLGNEQRYDQPIRGLIVSNNILHNQFIELAQKVM
jgi:myo-inositol-1(or 4)-monophosphatase